jgi:hypothetical protein
MVQFQSRRDVLLAASEYRANAQRCRLFNVKPRTVIDCTSKHTDAAVDNFKHHHALFRLQPFAFESTIEVRALVCEQAFVNVIRDAVGTDFNDHDTVTHVLA